MIDFGNIETRQLQKEAARALVSSESVNSYVTRINNRARHDSRLWYQMVVEEYIKMYGTLPSLGGPGAVIKLIDDV